MEKKKARKIKLLRKILKFTHADKILAGFVGFTFVLAFVILMVEPGINSYGDALWFCYAAITTIGFGDVVAITLIGRLCSVILSVYGLFALAIATGVVVSYYNDAVKVQQQGTIQQFMDKMERLPELSKAELEELSENVKKFKA